MSKLQQKKWFWTRRSRLFLGSKELQTSANKFKGSIFAVILGLIIGSIVIGATNNNTFTYFRYLLFFAFSDDGFNNWDNTLVWWSIYIIAGLALVMSFKAGMFNIGVVGQMLAAGAVVIAIGIRYDLSQPLAIIVALISGILAAALVAIVTALLKVYFNVHEVVTSILLNWTIWYLIKWFFTTTADLYDANTAASKQLHETMSFSIGDYKFILPLILALLLTVIVWFLLKKTTLGYKIKTVGLNPFAADYAGISRKWYGFTAFIISGALAGLMGVIYYVAMNPSLSFASDTLPAIGFDSISVALVGQINPIGIIASAFLWAVIKSGGPIGSVGLSIPHAVSDIIFGVIIYSAACAVLLAKFSPIKSLIAYFNIIGSRTRRKKFHQYLKQIRLNFFKTFKIKKQFKQKLRLLKQNKNSNKTKQELNAEFALLVSDKKENIQICYSQIHQEFKALKTFFSESYHKIWTSGLKGIKNQAIKEKKHLYGEKLNQYIKTRIAYEQKLYHLQQSLKLKVNLVKTQSESLFKEQVRVLQKTYQQEKLRANNSFNEQFEKLIIDEKTKIKEIEKQQKNNKIEYYQQAKKKGKR